MRQKLEDLDLPALKSLIADWLANPEAAHMPLGLEVEEAFRRAEQFRTLIAAGVISPGELEVDEDLKSVLYALVSLVTTRRDDAAEAREARAVYGFLRGLSWPEDELREKDNLIRRCAATTRRLTQQSEWTSPGERSATTSENETRKIFEASARLRRRRLTPEEGQKHVQRVLLTPIVERLERPAELHLNDPEMLLAILSFLPRLWETSPAEALAEASFLYEFLEKFNVRFPADPIPHDKREYFLGEAARIAGTACRFLSRREEARFWLDLAEAWFLVTEDSAANVARVSYQRLVLRTEEREFETVLKLLPQLIANFERQAMWEDALKARFLETTIHKEMGELLEAARAYETIIDRAKHLGSTTLLANAYVNVTQTYGFLGDDEKAMAYAREARALLKESDKVLLAKLQWGLGHLLRRKGNTAGSIEAFRESQRAFASVQMHADVAAVHLILGDLLLDAGQTAQAEWEVRAALPIIDEYKLVPEGIAALSLLRESLRRRQIDRQALRKLRGYFQDLDQET